MKIADFCLINSGSINNKVKRGMFLYLDTSNIVEGRINTLLEYKNYEELPSRARRTVKKNSIVYSTVRPAQKHFGIIREPCENMVVSTGFAVIDVNQNFAVPDYLYYFLTNETVVAKFQSIAELSTTAYPSIRFEDIENLEISLPPLKEQKEVASLLSTIDAKIELNQKISALLEEQALLLFDFMFQNTSSSKHIGDFITPQRGTALLSKDVIPGYVPVIAGGLEPAAYHNVANAEPPIVTISSSGANAGFVNLWGIPVWSSDSCFIDSKMSPYVYFWYALLKRHQNNIYKIQTGSAQPHIYPSHIADLCVFNLDFERVADYTERVAPLFKLITQNYKESNLLQGLKNWLLPMLMNGQATIGV